MMEYILLTMICNQKHKTRAKMKLTRFQMILKTTKHQLSSNHQNKPELLSATKEMRKRQAKMLGSSKQTFLAIFSSNICKMPSQVLSKTNKNLNLASSSLAEWTLNSKNAQLSCMNKNCKSFKKTKNSLARSRKDCTQRSKN